MDQFGEGVREVRRVASELRVDDLLDHALREAAES